MNIEIAEVIKITQKAGEEILQIYNSENFNVEIKADNSPLTRADKASHQIIEEGLKKIYPEIPILSEEGKEIEYKIRKNWKVFWLVDPLDGTKEFIKRNGEFTVNIAL
ncbi:MAG: 3'(2'),5'-bisphosphate nucleotidase CysQ, partial [Ignavibacteriae bacterium]|nr:3'(2'),5'-bisphosphate nucleotidase CysQ [Ignavibacteriota bacterium]